MNTKLLRSNSEGVLKAAELLRRGELVALPTETVYGLAANALDERGVAKIFKAKGRPSDNPLIVHILDFEDIDQLTLYNKIHSVKQALSHFMPGPLTVVLPKNEKIPDIVSGGLDSVAVRMPAHPVTRAVLEALRLPLAAPSANRSGSPSPTCVKHVLDDMDGRIAAVLDGGCCSVGVESTVLSLVGDVPEILRPGAVTAEQLREVLGEVRVAKSVLSPLEDGRCAPSPGMKYRHYAPQKPLMLFRGNSKDFARWCNSCDCAALCFDEDLEYLSVPFISCGKRQDYTSQAHMLFDELRSLDKECPAAMIAAHAPEPEGVGLAVYNRLLRASGFKLVEGIDLKEGDL